MQTKKLIFYALGILLLLTVTIGVTVSVFTYSKLGAIENTITTGTNGTLKLLYTENNGVGKGISITNALAVSDEVGKSYNTENYVFDFKVEETNTSSYVISYEVTLRKKSDSTLNENNVKIYLTDMTGDADTEILAPTLYSDLVQTQVDVGNEVEKILYNGTVNGGESNYEKSFRLRMWVKEDADSNEIGGQTFTALVNVYSNIALVEDIKETYELFGKEFTVHANPTLTTSSNNTTENGLYKSTETNDGRPTYYFRGVVENNYVSFAGQTWRVVRVNEDGTIRIVMTNGINDDSKYSFNSSTSDYTYMYYTNSEAKTTLEEWYRNNIANNTNYASKVAIGDYFCEQAKVKYSSAYTSGSATMEIYSSYTPNFKCNTDGNGKGIVNSNIGLLTYDEVVYAGGYLLKTNSSYYLYNSTDYWAMSPVGVGADGARAWSVRSTGYVYLDGVGNTFRLRAVLNLNADVSVMGSGTSTDPWTVVTS